MHKACANPSQTGTQHAREGRQEASALAKHLFASDRWREGKSVFCKGEKPGRPDSKGKTYKQEYLENTNEI